MSNVLGLIANLTTKKVGSLGKNSELGDWHGEEEDADVTTANVVTSLRTDRTGHAVLLDLDIPAYLVRSSRPGHTHLYIDAHATEEAYFELLAALVKCGVLESGYVLASKARGASYLRLPWVKKEGAAA